MRDFYGVMQVILFLNRGRRVASIRGVGVGVGTRRRRRRVVVLGGRKEMRKGNKGVGVVFGGRGLGCWEIGDEKE